MDKRKRKFNKSEKPIQLEGSSLNSNIDNIVEALRSITSLQNISKKFSDEILTSTRMPFEELSKITNPLADMQRQYQEQIKQIHYLAGFTSFNARLDEIVNNMFSFQVKAFREITVSSKVNMTYNSLHNKILTKTDLSDVEIAKEGKLNLKFEKLTQTDASLQVSFRQIETIQSKVELLGKDNQKFDKKMDLLLMEINKNSNSSLELVLNNPFPFFKIKLIKYIQSCSMFIINNEIKVVIPSKSHQYFICQILFSGIKKNLFEEWGTDEIEESMKPFKHDADWNNLTWKSIKETVNNINERIAMQTTKKDVILIPRPETIQLNPDYFSN